MHMWRAPIDLGISSSNWQWRASGPAVGPVHDWNVDYRERNEVFALEESIPMKSKMMKNGAMLAFLCLFATACGSDPSATGAIGPKSTATNDECPSGECNSGTNLATNEIALQGVDCAGETPEEADAMCAEALDAAMLSGQVQGICVDEGSARCGEGSCWITVELGCFVEECKVPEECDDGNPCTADFCLSSNTCYNPAAVNDGMSCDDGDACTEGDACEAGSCSWSTPKNCADGNVCDGMETCSSPSGTCLEGTPPVVDDGNPCTADSCDPVTGVTNTPLMDGTDCMTDEHGCTTQQCWDGACKVTSKDDAACADDNTCTLDYCHSVDGCKWTSLAGSVCGENMTCMDAAEEGAAPICTEDLPPTT